VYKVLAGKPEEKRPLERPSCRWDQNGSWGDWLGECRVDAVSSGLGSVAGCCKYCDEPLGSGATELLFGILSAT
jgi:hypothetical protein